MAQTYKAPVYKETAPYKSQYGDAINKLTDAVVNRQQFTYDPNTDASYQALAKQYGRLGDRARQNTLGDYAANTGGYASTAAVSAAQQAQNDYNVQLSNMIPQLMQAAYERYQGEYNMNLNALNAIGARDDAMYGRWSDNRDYNRNKYEYDNDFGWNQYRAKVGDEQWLKEFNYQKQKDATDLAYQKTQDKAAYNQWLKEFNLDKEKFNWSKQQGKSGSGGGSGRSGGGRSYSGGGSTKQKPTKDNQSSVSKVGYTTPATSDSYAKNKQTKAAAKKAEKEKKYTNTLQEHYTFVSGGMLNAPKVNKLAGHLKYMYKK